MVVRGLLLGWYMVMLGTDWYDSGSVPRYGCIRICLMIVVGYQGTRWILETKDACYIYIIPLIICI